MFSNSAPTFLGASADGLHELLVVSLLHLDAHLGRVAAEQQAQGDNYDNNGREHDVEVAVASG